MSRHRGTPTDALIRSALKDFDDACRTALELIRRDRHARAEWALVRAGRKVAAALGVTFDDHPLGPLAYFEPFKITAADIAREKKLRALAAQAAAAGAASIPGPTISGAACAPGGLVRPLVERTDHAAPESAPEAITGAAS